MRRLADKHLVPPGNFRYTDPDTGWTTVAPTYLDWIANAKDHRRANGLEIAPDFVAKAEDQLCGIIPPYWCTREAGDISNWIDTNFNWDDFKSGMSIFGHWAALGMPLVEQQEADRRGAICVSCPANVNVSGCSACHRMASLLTGAVAQKKGTYDDRLKACAICRCSLRALTWFESRMIVDHDGPDKQALRPDFCWAKENGENYRE